MPHHPLQKPRREAHRLLPDSEGMQPRHNPALREAEVGSGVSAWSDLLPSGEGLSPERCWGCGGGRGG